MVLMSGARPVGRSRGSAPVFAMSGTGAAGTPPETLYTIPPTSKRQSTDATSQAVRSERGVREPAATG
jgi:hypothetical protein